MAAPPWHMGRLASLPFLASPGKMLAGQRENAVCAMQNGTCSKLWSLAGLNRFPRDMLWYQDFSCCWVLLSLVKHLLGFAEGPLAFKHPMVSSQIPHYIHPRPLLALLLTPPATTRSSVRGWRDHSWIQHLSQGQPRTPSHHHHRLVFGDADA